MLRVTGSAQKALERNMPSCRQTREMGVKHPKFLPTVNACAYRCSQNRQAVARAILRLQVSKHGPLGFIRKAKWPAISQLDSDNLGSLKKGKVHSGELFVVFPRTMDFKNSLTRYLTVDGRRRRHVTDACRNQEQLVDCVA